jgi:DMSO/TMAO reductase YedYZ molybdopterin-dependent catalytic subunit
VLAFAIGRGWERWVIVAHGALGLGLLVLAPWKSAVARRGLRRHRPGTGASVSFAALVLVALATGIGHSTGLLRSFGPLTAMQVHVAAAVGTVPFALWHVFARPVRPRRTDLSRRVLLRAGLLGAGSLAAFGGLAAIVRFAGLPGRRARFTGSYPVEGAEFPVTQWLGDAIPVEVAGSWRLSVVVRGEPVAAMSLEELAAMGKSVRAVIDCTGGWFAARAWHAVRLDRLLDAAGVAGTRSVRAISVTGYSRLFPMADTSGLWLATAVEGGPLSQGHGAPARIVAPGRRGFWWVKWVTALDATDAPWWLQPPFPLQ